MKTFGERLEYVKRQKGLTNEVLAGYIGLKPDAIAKAIKRNAMKEFHLNIICDKIGISKTWLLDGSGDWQNRELNDFRTIEDALRDEVEIHHPKGNLITHEKSAGKQKESLVPFYEVDFAAGNDLTLIDSEVSKPDYYMDVPQFSGCTAFRAYNDSMERLIKSGSILFGTKLEDWHSHIEFGKIYGIIATDGRRYLKYIRKDKKNPKDYFLLVSENPTNDPMEMPKEKIRSIWLIKGWINAVI